MVSLWRACLSAPALTRRKGKQWHAPKKAFRPTAGLTSYEKRTKERALMTQMKAKENEMKTEKKEARQVQRSTAA